MHIKHPELVSFYKEYNGLKTSYQNFFARVTRYGQSKEDAILLIKPVKRPKAIKGIIDDNGRECTVCGRYKLWNMYHNSKIGCHFKTNNCIECRNRLKKEYRKTSNKDQEYKKRTRKLEIGSYIAFLVPVVIDGNPREDIREVKDYKYKKGYLLYSSLLRKYRRLDTGGNEKVNKNCKKFYKINKNLLQ